MPKLSDKPPPLVSQKPSYTTICSFEFLKKWTETLKKSSDKLSVLQSACSLNTNEFLFKQNPSSKRKKSDDDDQYAKVTLALESKETVLAKKLNILTSIANKIEDRKQIFAEIECLEYGVHPKTALDRVNLIIRLVKDISSFHSESQQLTIKKCHSYGSNNLDPISFICSKLSENMDDLYYTYDQIPSFLELFWWVAMSILGDDPDMFVLSVVEPVLLPTFLLAEILNECNIKARVSATYTPDATITAVDYSGKNAPMIVFSDANIDSALDTAVNAAWFTEGLVPWATTCILVQESIYPSFISSFKNKLLKSVENIAALLTNLNVEMYTQENIDSILSLAKEQNLEVFQVPPPKGNRVPATVVIGGFVSDLISHTSRNINKTPPIVFIAPFSTVEVGLSIANSSVDKIAASVWSGSFSTCSSSISQLNFGTIWINSYGVFDAVVPMFSQDTGCEPIRPTGFDYYEWNKSLIYFGSNLTSEDANYSEEAVLKSLSGSYAAYSCWMQKDMNDTMKILEEVWRHATECNFTLSVNLKKQLLDVVAGKFTNGSSFNVKHYSVSLTVEPVGIVIFVLQEHLNMKKHHLLKYVLSAIFSKNAVIVTGRKLNILSTLQAFFPENVLCLTGDVPLDNLCHIVRRHKLRSKISIWTLDEDETKCYTHWDGDFLKYYNFDKGMDIRPHMVRRKVVWMPHD